MGQQRLGLDVNRDQARATVLQSWGQLDAAKAQIESTTAQVNAIGSLSTIFFAPQAVNNYADAKRSDTRRYARFFREMLQRGIFLAPSQFEAAFVSASHTAADIDRTISAAADSLKSIAAEPGN